MKGLAELNIFTLLFVFLIICLIFVTMTRTIQPSIQTLSLASSKEQVWPTRVYAVNTMFPQVPHGPPMHTGRHPF